MVQLKCDGLKTVIVTVGNLILQRQSSFLRLANQEQSLDVVGVKGWWDEPSKAKKIVPVKREWSYEERLSLK